MKKQAQKNTIPAAPIAGPLASTLAMDLVKASSTVPAPKQDDKKGPIFYRPMMETPKKRIELFSYTESLFQLFGMRTIKLNGVDEKTFKAFTGMKKAVSYHTGKGNMETIKGMVKLTSHGLTFFTNRVDKGQTYDKDAISIMSKAYTTGKPSQAKTSIFKGVKFSKV